MKPWMTSNDLINAVKRKISFPVDQATFTEEEILDFANEEMMISQVPSVLSFHEEYFVTTKEIPLIADKLRYPIPDRAIGLKLRDVFWKDTNGNLYEMSRINPDDRAYFQENTGSNASLSKFYLEGNDIVLSPGVSTDATGSLLFVYFLRPNQLVKDERAAIAQYFVKTITVDNTTLTAGDTITINGEVFTAVAGAPSTDEFQIGGTSVITATNLTNTINTNGIALANNGTPSTAIVTVKYLDLNVEFETDNTSAFVIPSSSQTIEFDTVPDNIINGSIIDFLQTKPGHKIKGMEVTIPNNAISGNMITFNSSDIPEDFIIGDYICLENECIIPQIPPDLHNALAERTCARILSALGDLQGLQITNSKLQEIEARQGTLLDNRVEGAPQKVLNRNSLLRHGTMGSRRRL